MEIDAILAVCLKKHANTSDTSSTLEEIILNLDSTVFDYKKNILSQQFSVIVFKMFGMKYNSDIVIRNFEYYSTS